jgi:hypothetical protein
MTSIQIILIVIVLLCMLLWLHFRVKNRRIVTNFAEDFLILYTEIDIHKAQICKRNDGLNYYDFLKYNLSESLVVQYNIDL